jgi:hypothetical protein
MGQASRLQSIGNQTGKRIQTTLSIELLVLEGNTGWLMLADIPQNPSPDQDLDAGSQIIQGSSEKSCLH